MIRQDKQSNVGLANMHTYPGGSRAHSKAVKAVKAYLMVVNSDLVKT